MREVNASGRPPQVSQPQTPRLAGALLHQPPLRLRVGYLPIDRVRLEEVLALVEERVRRGEGACLLLPGVEQARVAEHHGRLRSALVGADLCLAGEPELVWAAQQVGRPLPEPRAGEEWLLPLLQRCRERSWRVFLVGAGPGGAERMAEVLRREHRIEVVGSATPMVSLEVRGQVVECLARRLEEARPHLVLVSMDTPRQELLCQSLSARLRRKVVLGAGQALQVLVAHPRPARPRAPGTGRLGWLAWLLAEPVQRLPRNLSFLWLVRRSARARQRAKASPDRR